MKQKKITLIAIMVLLHFSAISQGFSFSYMYFDWHAQSLHACDTVNISVSPIGIDSSNVSQINYIFGGQNILNQQFTATIDWGDGSVPTTHTGTSANNYEAIVWTPVLEHVYSASGAHTINTQLTEVGTSNSINRNYQITTGSCNRLVDFNIEYDCNLDGNIDSISSIPISAIYLQNSSNTVYPFYVSGFDDFTYFWPDPIPDGTYDVIIDPTWLNQSGFVVDALSPSTVTVLGSTPIPTVDITLGCANSSCLEGYVYCDDNANGTFDAGEIILSNAPLIISYNSSSTDIDTIYTNASGQYNTTWLNSSFSSCQIQYDTNWLSANGYMTSTSSYSLFGFHNSSWLQSHILTCDSIVDYNIPVNCSPSSNDTICVQGYLYCDDNTNGIFDAGEVALTNAPLIINGLYNNGTNVTIYTDSNGYYSYTDYHPGISTIDIDVSSSWLANQNYSGTYSITITDFTCTSDFNIGIDCTTPTPCTDLWTTLSMTGGYFQNTSDTIHLNYGGSSAVAPGNYDLTFTYPAALIIDFSSISNTSYTTSGNTITWSLTSAVGSFSVLENIEFTIPTGIPDSTVHLFSSTITPTAPDCNLTNNSFNIYKLVGVSYDPNDKASDQPLYIDPNQQELIKYTIRFQNTGTAPAQDVFILDTLSSLLDWSSFNLVQSSHQVNVINDNQGHIKFDFPQIWLPDSTTDEPASHGYVIYSIKENVNVPINNPIRNTAYIYFDQNPAIITNTTENINVTLGITQQEQTRLIVYPNPSTGLVNIESDDQLEQVNIFDLSGKLILTRQPDSKQFQINLSDVTPGYYMIQVKTENGITNKRFVITN